MCSQNRGWYNDSCNLIRSLCYDKYSPEKTFGTCIQLYRTTLWLYMQVLKNCVSITMCFMRSFSCEPLLFKTKNISRKYDDLLCSSHFDRMPPNTNKCCHFLDILNRSSIKHQTYCLTSRKDKKNCCDWVTELRSWIKLFKRHLMSCHYDNQVSL